MKYEGTIYRPPSEANSLIIQATVGCSHNKCTFCSMYKEKQFRTRPIEEVTADLCEARKIYNFVERIFLADGNALVLGADKLLAILEEIQKLFPDCKQTTIYGTPQDVLRKTPDELRMLSNAGLTIIYIGAESGDDEVLKHINKGADSNEIIKAIQRLEDAGIKASVTFISGLGGAELSDQHARGCARIINEAAPSYAALLTLLLEPSAPMYNDLQNGTFAFMTPEAIAKETMILLEHARPKTDCIFRSNHVSNYIPLRGTLPRDNEKLIAGLKMALKNNAFRDDCFRGL